MLPQGPGFFIFFQADPVGGGRRVPRYVVLDQGKQDDEELEIIQLILSGDIL